MGQSDAASSPEVAKSVQGRRHELFMSRKRIGAQITGLA